MKKKYLIGILLAAMIVMSCADKKRHRILLRKKMELKNLLILTIM